MDNADEKRSELRLNSQVAVFIELAPSPILNKSGTICITNTIDVSANGIQIVSDFPLPLNSLHSLRIEVADHSFKLVGEVMWISPHEKDTTIGFQLIESQQTDLAAWKQYICQQLVE